MIDLETLRKEAQLRLQRLYKLRSDPRFKKVVGILAAEQLLFGSEITPTGGKPTLEDALWAGNIEPRIFELLPAILARRPGLFLQTSSIPDDLKRVAGELKRGKPLSPFRGIPAEKYSLWIDKVVHRNKSRTGPLKAFRFTEDDSRVLNELRTAWGTNETGALRLALRIALKSVR